MSNATSDSLGNVSATQDQEVVFYEGSPKLRGESGLIAKCLIVALVLALIPFVLYYARSDNPDNSIVTWTAVICGLLALLVLLLPMMLVRKNRYRISNYRIDHEQGLLSKRIDTIELWHVEDVRMNQGLLDRMLGVGTINVRSNDSTSPMLPLRSLPQPRQLYDTIKQRVIAVKRQRGVVKFSGGLGHDHDVGGSDIGSQFGQ